LEIRDVLDDFQVEKYYPERKFFLAIIKDSENGYLYDGVIIRESEDMEQVMIAEIVDNFISDYKANKLHAYLKTEKSETEPFFEGNILRIYGSNFISLVKELKYAP
jgi:hypothetical protein